MTKRIWIGIVFVALCGFVVYGLTTGEKASAQKPETTISTEKTKECELKSSGCCEKSEKNTASSGCCSEKSVKSTASTGCCSESQGAEAKTEKPAASGV